MGSEFSDLSCISCDLSEALALEWDQDHLEWEQIITCSSFHSVWASVYWNFGISVQEKINSVLGQF